MADASQEDRTEAATPRRLQKAREEGQVPVSRELTTFAGLGAVALTLLVAGPQTVHDLTLRLSVFLARAHTLRLATVTRSAVEAGAWAAAPFIRDSAPFIRRGSPFKRDGARFIPDSAPVIRRAASFKRGASPFKPVGTPFIRHSIQLIRNGVRFNRPGVPFISGSARFIPHVTLFIPCATPFTPGDIGSEWDRE